MATNFFGLGQVGIPRHGRQGIFQFFFNVGRRNIYRLLFGMGAVHRYHGIGAHQGTVYTAGAHIVIGYNVAVPFYVDGIAQAQYMFFAGHCAQLAAFALFNVNYNTAFYFSFPCGQGGWLFHKWQDFGEEEGTKFRRGHGAFQSIHQAKT
jgi:hypothetical protein